jgi:hypothetical protein
LREGHEIGSRMGRVQGCALRLPQHIQLTNHPGRRFITISAPALYRSFNDLNTALFGRLYIYLSLKIRIFGYAMPAYLRSLRSFPPVEDQRYR